MSSFGTSINKPPIFNGIDYNLWKPRMTIFLKSLGEELWFSILDGWSEPTKIDPKNKKHTIPKPPIEWSQEEKSDKEINILALDTIRYLVLSRKMILNS